jgi:hypothetical protein
MRLFGISQVQHAGRAISIELNRTHAANILMICACKPKAEA